MTKVTISSKADHTRTGQVAYLPALEWPSILLSYNFLPVAAGQAGSRGHEVWNVVATSMSSDNYKCCFRASCNTTASPMQSGVPFAKDSNKQNADGPATPNPKTIVEGLWAYNIAPCKIVSSSCFSPFPGQ